LLALAFCPAAEAAEVVVRAPEQVRVTQGQVAQVPVEVRAEGIIGCSVTPSNSAGATLDSVYSLVGGQAAPATPGPRLSFYANSTLVLLPPLGCGVTWDGAPEPYRVALTVAAAPDTAPGVYTVPLSTHVTNPGGVLFARLEDDLPDLLVVTVEAPQTPADLPPPVEGRSINLLPVSGDVLFRYPGTTVSQRLLDAVQVPPLTGVNTREGRVTLLSDRGGGRSTQSANLWDGVFRVDYTRDRNPLRQGEPRAAGPITELTLRGRGAPCSSGAASIAARRRGRGLWARGKGRFRTRGRYGAGTVRGTWWRTEETCEGTLFRIRTGRVSVADGALRRSFLIRAGQSYLARPPGRGGVRG
jgi:hypothetical protein